MRVNCTNSNEIYAFHTGGANIVLGDGSVRFLAASVSIRVVARITRAGGEAVPGDYSRWVPASGVARPRGAFSLQ